MNAERLLAITCSTSPALAARMDCPVRLSRATRTRTHATIVAFATHARRSGPMLSQIFK